MGASWTDRVIVRDNQPPGWGGEQLGLMLRDKGTEAALENDAVQEWRMAAEVDLAQRAATGRPFSAEDVRSAVGDPPTPNVLGALFLTAKRRGQIRHYDTMTPTRSARHGNRLSRWVGVE